MAKRRGKQRQGVRVRCDGCGRMHSYAWACRMRRGEGVVCVCGSYTGTYEPRLHP